MNVFGVCKQCKCQHESHQLLQRLTGHIHEAHPLTLMMKDATTQAPSCVASELTKCGPMMRRDDVSMIT
jgi:hypothetical protein